jgi:NAD(P)-dependent dehydrogenase (short-subunit alcohol dehydrogenase family)
MTESTPEPRSVLVTGGNRGIGRSIAEEFLRRGDRVAVTSRSGTGGPEGALTVAADVTDGDRPPRPSTGRSRCSWPTPASRMISCCCG